MTHKKPIERFIELAIEAHDSWVRHSQGQDETLKIFEASQQFNPGSPNALSDATAMRQQDVAANYYGFAPDFVKGDTPHAKYLEIAHRTVEARDYFARYARALNSIVSSALRHETAKVTTSSRESDQVVAQFATGGQLGDFWYTAKCFDKITQDKALKTLAVEFAGDQDVFVLLVDAPTASIQVEFF